MGYSDYRKQLSPPWLRGKNGDAWNDAHGAREDEVASRAKEAVKATFPALAPADALPRIGSGVQLERYAGESESTYRARLAKPFSAWRNAGTARGLLTALADAGYPSARLMTVLGEDAHLDANGNLVIGKTACRNWAIDATPEFWSKYQVLLPAPHPWAMVGPMQKTAGMGQVIPGGVPRAAYTINVTVQGPGVAVAINGGEPKEIAVDAHRIISLDDHFPVPTGIELTLFGDFMPGQAATFTTGVFPAADSQTVNMLRRIIRQWQPAHATCAGIVVHTAGLLFGWTERTFAAAGVLGVSRTNNRVIWSI